MSNIVFLDTEFTDLLNPELLSIGLVTLSGVEHYVELDLSTEAGQARVRKSSDFVRLGVLNFWGLVPEAACTASDMGRRTGEWLLKRAEESGTPVEVAFDFVADYELLARAIRDSGLWDQVREVVAPININKLTGTIEGELEAEECLRSIARRGLQRHHALADALALRAAYLGVKRIAVELGRAQAGRSS